jgi:hypothetical protein
LHHLPDQLLPRRLLFQLRQLLRQLLSIRQHPLDQLYPYNLLRLHDQSILLHRLFLLRR